MKTLEENKKLVQSYVERVWNQGDLAALKSLTTTDFTYLIGGQPARNLSGMEQFITDTHVAFPDWRIEIVEILAEGKKVVIRWQGQVTHRGVFNGVPPTGKRIAVSGINIYQIEGGKISLEWEQTDTVGMLLQMGILSNRTK
ncbi:MAG TPA: ester cyclase [Chlamydiales bacterium]|nr:ester cyclase [Chlamydiales bacterium]